MDDRRYFEGAAHYDRETVRFFDVAHEGAQLRIAAAAAATLEHLHGDSPRSVVVIPTDQFARAAVHAIVDLRAPLSLPIVVTDQLPGYVGPLDVVVVVGDAGDNEVASRALVAASRRGAETVLAGPARGPLIDDAPDAAAVIPTLPTAAGPSPLRAFGVVAAVLDLLTLPAEPVRERLDILANEVDAELQALTPERDESVNAARQLRGFAAQAHIIHTGVEPIGAATARAAAHMWSARGLPSGAVDRRELASALEQAPGQNEADIFHDPFLDGGDVRIPVRTLVWNHEGALIPGSRGEVCEQSSAGAEGTCARLLVRALAATVMEQPVS